MQLTPVLCNAIISSKHLSHSFISLKLLALSVKVLSVNLILMVYDQLCSLPFSSTGNLLSISLLARIDGVYN